MRVVVDEDLAEVAPGEAGELLMTGPQRTPGYWQDDAATARRSPTSKAGPICSTAPATVCVVPPTADRYASLAGSDQQIKVRGHRVELGEVESALRQVPGVEAAAALGGRRLRQVHSASPPS